MRVLRINEMETWRSHAAAWEFLARGVPFRTWDWLANWWEVYGQGTELAVVVVLDDQNHLVGAAPWCVTPGVSSGRVLRPLGAGEVCTEYASILCGVEYEAAVCESIAMWLTQPASDFRWDLLEMECVPATDRAIWRLTQHLGELGCTTNRTPGPNLWNIPLPASWPEYLALLSKSHRKQIQRLLRGLLDTGRAELRIARTASEVAAAMNSLIELHQKRWRRLGQPGVFASSRMTQFLDSAANRFFTRSELLLAELWIDGRLAAVDFHLATSAANYVYQGAIEPDLAELSPGKLLTALLIQEAIQHGRTSFDFLRGDELYKPHFRAVPTETNHWRVVPQRAAAQLRNGLWWTGMAMKNAVKAGLSLTGLHPTTDNPPPTPEPTG